jgi:hypothetical protein
MAKTGGVVIAMGVIRFLVGLLDALFLADTGGGVTSTVTGLASILALLAPTSTSILSAFSGSACPQVAVCSVASLIHVEF